MYLERFIVSLRKIMENNNRKTELRKLEIEVTSYCNLRCLHCSMSCTKYKQEINIDKILDLIDEFTELGGNRVTITGGEPFSIGFEKLNKIINKCIDNELKIYIYTTGQFLNDEFIREYKGNNLLRFCITLLGNEKIHNSFTNSKNSFAEVIKALYMLQKYDISTCIHYVLTKINFDQIVFIMEMARKYKIDLLKIFQLTIQGRALENKDLLIPTTEQITSFCKDVNEHYKESDFELESGGIIPGFSKSCSIGKKIAITYDGYGLPCLGLSKRIGFKKVYGNIFSDTLTDIWKKIYKQHNDGICICTNLDDIF